MFFEHREKVIYKINNDNITYQQIRTWHYAPELSAGSLDDKIFHLNVPVVAAFSLASKRPPAERPFLYDAINKMIGWVRTSTVFTSDSRNSG